MEPIDSWYFWSYNNQTAVATFQVQVYLSFEVQKNYKVKVIQSVQEYKSDKTSEKS